MRKISVQVKTNSRVETVETAADGGFVVRVRVPPIEGRANERVRELLAEHLGLPKSKVTLFSGEKSKKKVFAVG